MTQTFSEWKKISDQPLRVYRDSSDTTGQILCRRHRDEYCALNPAARGAGEYGGDCEVCECQRPMTTPDGHCPEQFRRSDCNHTYSHWPAAEPGTIEPQPWNGGPGNKRDRARFLALTAAQRLAASELAASKYDSTRTVARCWAEALDECR